MILDENVTERQKAFFALQKVTELMNVCSKKFKCKFFLAAGSNNIEQEIVDKIQNSEHKNKCVTLNKLKISETLPTVSYTHLPLPTTPYV